MLFGPHDSLFGVAKDLGSDWLTMWSLNTGNPDTRQDLDPKYFAHAYAVQAGDKGDAIMRRFGMNEAAFRRANPTMVDVQNLPTSSKVCVVPGWHHVTDSAGRPLCS